MKPVKKDPKFVPAPVPGVSAWDSHSLTAQNKLAVEATKIDPQMAANSSKEYSPYTDVSDHQKAQRNDGRARSTLNTIYDLRRGTSFRKEGAKNRNHRGKTSHASQRQGQGRRTTSWDHQIIPMGPYLLKNAGYGAMSSPNTISGIDAGSGGPTFPEMNPFPDPFTSKYAGHHYDELGVSLGLQSPQFYSGDLQHPDSKFPYALGADFSHTPRGVVLPKTTNAWGQDSSSVASSQSPLFMQFQALAELGIAPPNSAPIQSATARTMTLEACIKKQLLYYFSVENLCKDLYLRSLFDRDTGAVALSEITKFRKLSQLAGLNMSLVKRVIDLDCVGILESMVVKDEDAVRVKEWRRWLM